MPDVIQLNCGLAEAKCQIGGGILVAPVVLPSGVTVDFVSVLMIVFTSGSWDRFMANKYIRINCPSTNKAMAIQRDMVNINKEFERIYAQIDIAQNREEFGVDYFGQASPKVLMYLVQTVPDETLMRYCTVAYQSEIDPRDGCACIRSANIAQFAAMFGKVETLKLLHRLSPALLADGDEVVMTPAVNAIMTKKVNVLQVLHTLNPELIKAKLHGVTTLAELAIGDGNVGIIQALLDLDVSLFHERNEDGLTPAMNVVHPRDVAILRAMHAKDPGLLKAKYDGNVTLAHIAASGGIGSILGAARSDYEGMTDVIKVLYELDASLFDEKDAAGNTPAMIAAANGSEEVQQLIQTLIAASKETTPDSAVTTAPASSLFGHVATVSQDAVGEVQVQQEGQSPTGGGAAAASHGANGSE